MEVEESMILAREVAKRLIVPYLSFLHLQRSVGARGFIKIVFPSSSLSFFLSFFFFKRNGKQNKKFSN